MTNPAATPPVQQLESDSAAPSPLPQARGSYPALPRAHQFLSRAASFTMKMIHRYVLVEQGQGIENGGYADDHRTSRLHQDVPASGPDISRKLREMSFFLERIRNIQQRSSLMGRLEEVEDDASAILDLSNFQNEPSLSADVDPVVSPGLYLGVDNVLPVQESTLVLFPVESATVGKMGDEQTCSTKNMVLPRNETPFENPDNMITCVTDKLDSKAFVRDALLTVTDHSPLAVLQPHLQQLKKLVSDDEARDIFNTDIDIGRNIAYDMFLEGETELAIMMLQYLGENLEISLKQLLLGTTRRSMRRQIAEQMKRLGYLKLNEGRILETIALIERSYPQISFWVTYTEKYAEAASNEADLSLLHLQVLDNFSIKCGDVDGVVLDPWANILESSMVCDAGDDTHQFGYWACAAVWSDAWNERAIDRIVLDQHKFLEARVPWESELEYHISHNNWTEVEKLLDDIPTSLLSEGSLKINMETIPADGVPVCNESITDNGSLICSSEELGAVCLEIPSIKIFQFSVDSISSLWMKMLIEQSIASDFIFLKDYWESILDIVPLLARSGTFAGRPIDMSEATKCFTDMHSSEIVKSSFSETCKAIHKLFMHYCMKNHLPSLMELYLDNAEILFDKNSLYSLLKVTGGCQWSKWLLLMKVKGCEYAASFANASYIFSQKMVPGCGSIAVDIEETLLTVDDMADGGGELAGLATLMYAPLPIQECLCKGSVSRHGSTSFQCTLENLKHGLQNFPTLWKTLVAFSIGPDPCSYVSSTTANNSQSDLENYLMWRDSLFSSTEGDTSLLHMLPCWFSKSIRKLIKIFVQGPRWELPSDDRFTKASCFLGEAVLHSPHEGRDASPVSWEVAIQRSMEKLYCFQEKTIGIEHNLHRGRPMAAFNLLLSLRAHGLSSMHNHEGTAGDPILGQTNFQSVTHSLLKPITQSERSQVLSVISHAIMHFEDSVFVISCTLLLEFCGLSADMLRLDVAVLQRISSYYKSAETNSTLGHASPKAQFNSVFTEDLTVSFARTLAEYFLQQKNQHSFEQSDTFTDDEARRSPSWNLMDILQHLEKASLPSISDTNSSGYWLSTGIGHGSELRSQQKAASQYWHLVTLFCQMHHLPLSTKYLSALAKDNDWIGFLIEAQNSKFPLDTVIKVANKEFCDPRLKMHIVTILKSMQSLRQKSSSKVSESMVNADIFFMEGSHTNPAELFGLVSECERQKYPGKILLLKARDLRWPLLALVASCFPDVSAVSCLTIWLEISVARESSSMKISDVYSEIANNVGAAVDATNMLPVCDRILQFHYNRKTPKRIRRSTDLEGDLARCESSVDIGSPSSTKFRFGIDGVDDWVRTYDDSAQPTDLRNPDERLSNLSNMISLLCEKRLFLSILRAFEIFLPSCSLLPFICSLQAFSQTRLSEASAHLTKFSSRIKESAMHANLEKHSDLAASWISTTAVKAAKSLLSSCPSAYESRNLLKLLSSVDFGDGGSAGSYFQRLYWKISFSEPLFRKGGVLPLGAESLDDASILEALLKSAQWEHARNWAKQLDSSDEHEHGKPSVHVTEMQAEAMVAEWKEFLWDVPEERAAIWSHCHILFDRHSFPALQAGKFFLKHAEAIEKEIPARELHELLLRSLLWLSGFVSKSDPVYPLHLLRDIETRVWLLAVESEAHRETERDFLLLGSSQNLVSVHSSIIEQTASIISQMDNHIDIMANRYGRKNETSDSCQPLVQPDFCDSNLTFSFSARPGRKSKVYQPLRRSFADNTENRENEDCFGQMQNYKCDGNMSKSSLSQSEIVETDTTFSGWEESFQPAQLERAILSLLKFGQIQAARQLQQKLSPMNVPSELATVHAALTLASFSSSSTTEISTSMLDPDARSVVYSCTELNCNQVIDQVQTLQSLAMKCGEGCGRGLCQRIVAILKVAKALCIPFSEAFEMQPVKILQLLTLKGQECLEEARLLVQSHIISPANIASILAESFLKGVLAAHRGGYMDSQREEGPAPLLWRASDFLKWAELCPAASEVGHALTRLVMTSQEIPYACEVELLILAHHFYQSSSCLGGVDVLLTLAANRVESYVSERDFSCLARLVTGVGNFHALSFIFNILIENNQLELLLQKFSAEDASNRTESVRAFRMAVLTAIKRFDPHNLDAIAMVYNHFDMKQETSSLLERRSELSLQRWLGRPNKDEVNEDLLEAMSYLIEAAEVYSSIDAGQKTHKACALANLISLQIRIPDYQWLNLSETNARRLLSEQSRFQEALVVSEAYGLNKPSEWAIVWWNLMLRSNLAEKFITEFVNILPLQSSMLTELARYYRNEVAARGERPHFSWLSTGGMSSESVKHLSKTFRSLLRQTRNLQLRMQLATIATGFTDVIKACAKVLDKVPDNSCPLILRRGHGGAYLPLM